jgi:hypothetical protein
MTFDWFEARDTDCPFAHGTKIDFGWRAWKFHWIADARESLTTGGVLQIVRN